MYFCMAINSYVCTYHDLQWVLLLLETTWSPLKRFLLFLFPLLLVFVSLPCTVTSMCIATSKHITVQQQVHHLHA